MNVYENVDTCILGNLLPFSFSMDGNIFGEGFIFFSRPSTFVDLFGTAWSSSHLLQQFNNAPSHYTHNLYFDIALRLTPGTHKTSVLLLQIWLGYLRKHVVLSIFRSYWNASLVSFLSTTIYRYNSINLKYC